MTDGFLINTALEMKYPNLTCFFRYSMNMSNSRGPLFVFAAEYLSVDEKSIDQEAKLRQHPP